MEVRVERRDGYWLVIGLAAPGATATTIGPVIFMRARGLGDRRLLLHELEHVRQYAELGLVGFFRRYLAAYFAWRLRGYTHWPAYRRVPLEVEAEWVARRTVEGPRLPS